MACLCASCASKYQYAPAVSCKYPQYRSENYIPYVLLTKDDTLPKVASDIEYRDGKEWFISIKDKYIVEANLEITYNYGKVYQLNLLIKNCNNKSILFEPCGNIDAVLIDRKGELEKLCIYSSDDFLKKIKKQQTLALVLQGISSGVNSFSAGYQSNYTTSRVDGYTYTHNVVSYNPAVANMANTLSRIELRQMGKDMEEDRRVIECGYLKKNTIHSNFGIAGFVNMKRKSRGTVLYISVSVDSTIHYFKFNVKPL